MAYKYTLAEQETIIRYDQESKLVTVYTHDPVLIRKMNKRFEGVKQDGATTYTVPKKLLRISPAAQRNMTEEQRQAAAARLLNTKRPPKTPK